MKQIPNLTPKTRELLNYIVLQYMLDTYCENPGLGKAFVDNDENPATCILSLKHWLFFGGKPSEDCMNFLSGAILTNDIRDSQHIFYMVFPDEEWKNALTEILPGSCCQYERSLYKRDLDLEYADNTPLLTNIAEITPVLMNSKVENLDMIINEVVPTGTYNNLDDFLARGFGFAPIINNKVSGFCTSEYPSKSAIAIGIEVLGEYQRQGYAKAMTKAFLYKAAQRDLKVYWECWKSNIASANTALSCGFEKVSDYPILFVRL